MNSSRLFYLIFVYSGIFILNSIASGAIFPKVNSEVSKTLDLLSNLTSTWREANLTIQNARCVANSKKAQVLRQVYTVVNNIDTTIIEAVPDTTLRNMGIIESPKIKKIKVPVGVIMWDVYYRDYWLW